MTTAANAHADRKAFVYPAVDAMADVAVAVSMWAPGVDGSQTVERVAIDAFEDLYHEAAAEPKVVNT